MAANITHQLIESHLVSGALQPETEIGLRIDQTLTQDATGTLVMLELEAIGLEHAKTDVSVQYVDHNLLQEDHKNPDDHLFLESAAQRFGLWFSRPGNGVLHPLHQERFGKPGATLLGSDSHTCAAGAIGMLAIGAGGLEVAMAMDRHVIANMGAELGATTSVFPADEVTQRFLESQGRPQDWQALQAEPGAKYDRVEVIDLSGLEPLIALPTSPGNVVPVRQVAGEPIYQAYIGSSANPGYRDFAIVAEMCKGRRVADGVSLDINPTSRQILQNLASDGHVLTLLKAGARLHQAGCNGCIGMGQAPATNRINLRTVPRNFPGRSGTREDAVHLCSPETAAASALAGRITSPCDTDRPYPSIPQIQDARFQDTQSPIVDTDQFTPPPKFSSEIAPELIKGPNIQSLPRSQPLADSLEMTVLLSVADNISTDEIMPAGARVLPFRSNIARIAEFVFIDVDPTYVGRAKEHAGGHAEQLRSGPEIAITNTTRSTNFVGHHTLSQRQQQVITAGGLIPWLRSRNAAMAPSATKA